MALQLLKETKISAANLCRLSPPSSPSRRSTASNAVAKPPFKSRILAALDGELDVSEIDDTSNALYPPPKSIGKPGPSNVRMHPMFVKSKQPRPFSLGAPIVLASAPPAPSTTVQKAAGKSKATAKKADATKVLAVDASSSKAKADEVSGKPFSYKDYTPSPAVVYTRHEEEANDLVQMLKGPLGFDLEWRVFFQGKGSAISRRTAVVQLCDKRMILVIQVSAMKKFPQKVKEVIESPSVVKAGANIRNDGVKLFEDFGIEASNLVELGAYAHQADASFPSTYKRKIVSLSRMTKMYCDGKVLDKGQVRTGNWETQPLSEEQLFYAANDAYSAWLVYKKLSELAKANGVTPNPSTFTGSVTAKQLTRAVAPVPAVSETSSTDPSQAPSTASSLNTPSMPTPPPRPQHLRAYTMWHHRKLPLSEICALLRSRDNPLAESTVISYVIGALQADITLPYSMTALKELVQLETGSWARHRDWILRQAA